MVPKQTPLEEMTLRQLRRVASQYNISRYSRMRKEQLITALRQAMREETVPYPSTVEGEQAIEAAKFDVGQEDVIGGLLSSVDDQLGDLPDGYGDSRIVLLPRDPQWAYAYWDVPNEAKEALRQQGGKQLALRLYDVTHIDLNYHRPHSVQEYVCDESVREWYIPIPVSDRHYLLDIGYRCFDGRWLILARSAPVRIPSVYPSDWVEDIFITVDWNEDLQGKTLCHLVSPGQTGDGSFIYDDIFALGDSVFGSIPHIAGSLVSSYIFPSGVGSWAFPTESGLNMSGLGLSASGVPEQPRKFWLVADAELIVYGATEPDAIVTIGGHPIKLNPDGTFRFQMSFQDGLIDYPIVALASDGEQSRSIHMKFTRETPDRQTNSKEEAVLEWP
ncbi:Rho termination factor domain protein [Rippkaea orientalis PCC 8801]|uniref:Rho termination factor domain protein n=1 Tax=Rippkaea orientalis (strain PCC 8801 / RF-1) TaxID=41431 RepID=B7JVK8_RIPO1|nr:DUF4912 domain-containing protein [Rippkaea orientalis]ACK64579.1 Rho termination factor domain protein [Rippkaea orientalis PCC 8801]